MFGLYFYHMSDFKDKINQNPISGTLQRSPDAIAEFSWGPTSK